MDRACRGKTYVTKIDILGTICKNWPRVRIVLKTNKGQHITSLSTVAALSQLAQLAVYLVVQSRITGELVFTLQAKDFWTGTACKHGNLCRYTDYSTTNT